MTQKYKILTLFIFTVGIFSIFLLTPRAVAAATITVNSTADDQSDDGECTFREAIIANNTDTASGATTGECSAGSGVDTINFNIVEAADFTNGGQSGYTIAPQSPLPGITGTVTINGYSQPGALVNTALAPNPLNGRLLIEIDGSSISGVTGLDISANGSTIRGLVLNRFNNNSQRAVGLGADNLNILGNYIGTDPTGLIARPNHYGIPIATADSDDANIGGLLAAERNLISGNLDSAITPNDNSDNWTIRGNYIGVDVTGLTALPNNTGVSAGALSLDNSDGHIVGGSQPAAINVISGNASHGIAPHGTSDVVVEGNYIGVGYNGTTELGNGSGGSGSGIYFSLSSGMRIEGNIVASSASGGILIGGDSSDGEIVNNTSYNNTASNIGVIGLSVIGEPTDNVVITGNKVGYDMHSQPTSSNQVGVSVVGDPSNIQIGGDQLGEGNSIINSEGSGIGVRGLYVNAFSTGFYPSNVTILGNSISGTTPGVNAVGPGEGLGIDFFSGIDTDSSPDGEANTYESTGPTLNDSSDPDVGPNNYINFPVLNTVTQSGQQATVNFNLDAAGSPDNQYRVEFFANEEADPSGYGEGQIFLGAATVSNGDNQQTSLSLPANFSLANMFVSATTTAVDSSTSSGFGGTSEFSSVLLASVESVEANDNLASTGTGLTSALSVVLSVFMIAAGLLVARRVYELN